MKNNPALIKRVSLTLLTLFVIAYIFINSSFDADSSDAQSMGVTEMINSFLHSLNIDITFSNNFVRKCAHFAEYFLLGTLLFYTVKSYVSKLWAWILLAPLTGLVVASVDETIQLFSIGRSGQVSDVLLDFCGVCTAVLIFYVFCVKLKSRKDKDVYDE